MFSEIDNVRSALDYEVSCDAPGSEKTLPKVRTGTTWVGVRGQTFDKTVPSCLDSFEFFHKFVEHIVGTNTSGAADHGHRPHTSVDWAAIRNGIAGSDSIEQAIGRAVVMADRMSRGEFPNPAERTTLPFLSIEQPFFAFSVADAVPDFGDQRRYRTRMTRTVGRVLKPRRSVIAAALSLVPGVALCVTLVAHGVG